MDLSPTERARIVVRYLAKKNGITQGQIGMQLGYTNKTGLSAVLNGHKTMPAKFGKKLASLDPEINPKFLSGESDDMLLPGQEQPPIPELFIQKNQQDGRQAGVYMPLEMVQMFTDLSATIRSQQETIRLLVGKGDAGAKDAI